MGRAIHLEIVENCSAEAFLQALRRFVSHHGWPDIFNSDSGKCFFGTEKELKKLLSEGRRDINDFAVPHSALINQGFMSVPASNPSVHCVLQLEIKSFPGMRWRQCLPK